MTGYWVNCSKHFLVGGDDDNGTDGQISKNENLPYSTYHNPILRRAQYRNAVCSIWPYHHRLIVKN